MSEDRPEGNTTIDSALTCPNPDVTSPTGQPLGPFLGIQTVGLYQNPQPSLGWRPRLLSLSLTVQNSADLYDVSLAPEWIAAFIPSVDAPKSVADFNSILAATGPLVNPASHAFFFRPGAPDPLAVSFAFRSNGGKGYVPPVDATGRWWGLLVRGNDLPIGGVVRISANWTVERDPQIRERELRTDLDDYPEGTLVPEPAEGAG